MCAMILLWPKHVGMIHVQGGCLSTQDLTHLNRPLTKVIMVDVDPNAVEFQRENSILLNKWTGDITDTTLQDLVPFLLSQYTQPQMELHEDPLYIIH